MDVDNDVDQSLLSRFSSMGTTDRDVLVQEFQKVLGPSNNVNPDCCAFFLDMNNWNLQAAICSYLDYEVPREKVPLMSFVKDVTIGEGEAVAPNTRFTKTWRLQNTGEERWPLGCTLKFLTGNQLGPHSQANVAAAEPKQSVDISIQMLSPREPGTYQGQWRMCAPNGMYFGEIIWVILVVEASGLLGVTQQLESFNMHPSSQNNSSAEHTVPNAFQNPVSAGSVQSDCHRMFASTQGTFTASDIRLPPESESENCLKPAQRNHQFPENITPTVVGAASEGGGGTQHAGVSEHPQQQVTQLLRQSPPHPSDTPSDDADMS